MSSNTVSRDVARYASAEGYREAPSVRVSRGGSPVFYFRRHPETNARQWIIRTDGVWTFEYEDPADGKITRWRFWHPDN